MKAETDRDELLKRLAYCVWIEITGRAYKNPALPGNTLDWADELNIDYMHVEDEEP